MTKWQPIETAPKDGSVVILTALENGIPFETHPMQWGHITINDLFPGIIGMWVSPDGSYTWNGIEEDGGPTHWMPLPEPPTE